LIKTPSVGELKEMEDYNEKEVDDFEK